MDLSIIIVNWNSKAYLEKCLTSVYENTHGLDFEVIVVDNASFDGCGEMLAGRFPQIKFIQSQTNLGFAGANNLGFCQSSGRTLLFLNPDTEVIGAALPTMFAALTRTPDAGVVGARLLNSDGSIQTSCIQRFPSFVSHLIDTEFLRAALPRLRLWGSWPLLENQAESVPVDMISGACMMVRRSSFDRIGLFSTNYFMYAEDLDLCFRFRQAGFSNYYVHDAIVVHHGGVTASLKGPNHLSAVVMRDSVFKFFTRHRGKTYAAAYRATVVLASIIRCTVLAALFLIPHGGPRFRAAFRKWIAVLRWGLGMTTIRLLGRPPRGSVDTLSID